MEMANARRYRRSGHARTQDNQQKKIIDAQRNSPSLRKIGKPAASPKPNAALRCANRGSLGMFRGGIGNLPLGIDGKSGSDRGWGFNVLRR
jgi:hypothetical protein